MADYQRMYHPAQPAPKGTAPLMTTQDPLQAARAYTSKETGYMRQHQPSPYSTFEEPTATPAAPSKVPVRSPAPTPTPAPVPAQHPPTVPTVPTVPIYQHHHQQHLAPEPVDPYTTKTTWSFPDDEQPTQYPGLEEIMRHQSYEDVQHNVKEARKQAKLHQKEEDERLRFQQER